MSSSSISAMSRLKPCRTSTRITTISVDVRRHRVGGHLPAAHPQPVGEVEQRIARIGAVLDHPGDRRDALAAVAVERQLERSELADLAADVLRRVIAVLLDATIALPPEPQEQVVLEMICPPGREKFSAKVGMFPPR